MFPHNGQSIFLRWRYIPTKSPITIFCERHQCSRVEWLENWLQQYHFSHSGSHTKENDRWNETWIDINKLKSHLEVSDPFKQINFKSTLPYNRWFLRIQVLESFTIINDIDNTMFNNLEIISDYHLRIISNIF